MKSDKWNQDDCEGIWTRKVREGLVFKWWAQSQIWFRFKAISVNKNQVKKKQYAEALSDRQSRSGKQMGPADISQTNEIHVIPINAILINERHRPASHETRCLVYLIASDRNELNRDSTGHYAPPKYPASLVASRRRAGRYGICFANVAVNTGWKQGQPIGARCWDTCRVCPHEIQLDARNKDKRRPQRNRSNRPKFVACPTRSACTQHSNTLLNCNLSGRPDRMRHSIGDKCITRPMASLRRFRLENLPRLSRC